MDRRSAKTEKLLKDALIKLMTNKEFEKISIKDLTEEADINRVTFYLHYKDKYDLLEQSGNKILEEMDEIKNNIAEKYPSKFILPSDKEKLMPVFVFVYSYIKENADFMKVVLGSNGDLHFQMKFKNFVEDSLVKNMFINHKIAEIPLKYISTVASSAQVGVIQKWLNTGMKETPEELASIISDVVGAVYKVMIVAPGE